MCSEQEQVVVRGSEDLGLEQATRRRISWTPPPKDTFTILTSSDPPESIPAEADIHSERIEPISARNGFGNLRQDFGFTPVKDDAECIRGNRGPDAQPATKKRRLEFVGPLGPERLGTAPADKANATTKASKRKARTITEQATAQYAIGPNCSVSPSAANLTRTGDVAENANEDFALAQKQSRSKHAAADPESNSRKGVKERKGSAKRPKKDDPKPLPLLSPRSACRQIGRQEVVFGTSSQLANGQSGERRKVPGAADMSLGSCPSEAVSISFTPSLKSHNLWSGSAASRSLWSVSARDSQSLLVDNVIDVSAELEDHTVEDEAESMREGRQVLARERSEDASACSPDWKYVDDDSVVCVDTPRHQTPRDHKEGNDLSGSIQGGVPRLSQGRGGELGKKPAKADAARCPIGPPEPTKEQTGAGPGVADGGPPDRPDFNGYLTSQLTSTLASYGFKPVKSRKGMIALLEKCWNEGSRAALKPLGVNTKVQRRAQSSKGTRASQKEMPTKSDSGRPGGEGARSETSTGRAATSKASSRKKKTKEAGEPSATTRYGQTSEPAQLAEAMSDAAKASSKQKKAQRPKRPPKTSPAPLITIPESPPATPVISPAVADHEFESQAHRFASITRAVRHQPLSTSKDARTWHEKILTYDPIVLEDFAIWLNMQGLAAVGEDFEVGPAEARAWCQAKGVCCLWRENLRGESRRRR